MNMSSHTFSPSGAPSHMQSGASIQYERDLPGLVPPRVSSGTEPVGADASLGLASGNFAKLYGLTSDMEPILMVGGQASRTLQLLIVLRGTVHTFHQTKNSVWNRTAFAECCSGTREWSIR